MNRVKRSLVLAGAWACLLSSCGTEGVQRPLPEGSAPASEAPPVGEAAPGAAAAEGPRGHGSAKSAAPVDITAEIGAGTAEVRVAFRVDATDVSVKAWGTDGLSVQGNASPVVGRAVKQGERVTAVIAFVAPAGASNLAIGVSGMFGSRRQSAVKSFAIGGASAPSGAGDVRVDPDGRPVRVMKPQ